MAGKRTVFVVNIEKGCDSEGLFDSMYGSLMKILKNIPSLSVSIIDSVDTFEARCDESDPKETVLLFTNEFLAKNMELLDIVKHFAVGGGLVIFGCLFSSFTSPPLMNEMFKNLGLPWKHSEYIRRTFGITEVGRFLFTGLEIEEKYSAKALQLSNVFPEQKLYKPTENTTSTAPNLVMSAFGKMGSGAIAYIGDVNAEEGSDRLTAALCLAKWE